MEESTQFQASFYQHYGGRNDRPIQITGDQRWPEHLERRSIEAKRKKGWGNARGKISFPIPFGNMELLDRNVEDMSRARSWSDTE